MTDAIFWKPHRDTLCADGEKRTVYVRGHLVNFVGWMAAHDTAFSCPAYVMRRGQRVKGFVGNIGEYDSDNLWGFTPYDREAHKLSNFV